MALDNAIKPYRIGDVTEVRGYLYAMFGGFRSMRQMSNDEAQRMMDLTLTHLRDFPAWAIKKACEHFAVGKGNPHYAPNDADLADTARDLVRPYRDSLARVTELLEAVT